MAVIDTTKKRFIQDRDEKVFIGLDMPFHKSDGVEGWFKCTTNTIDAVKVNLKNFILTHQGERLMKPTFGNPLRENLFEQIDQEGQTAIMKKMVDVIVRYFPYISILEMHFNELDEGTTPSLGVGGRFANGLSMKIVFGVRNSRSMIGTVDVDLARTNI